MKLIAGLGNPGDKYDLTRHNVGWHAIDALARFLDCRVYVNRSSGLTGTAYYEGEKLPEDFICPLCGHPASDFEPVYDV